MFYVEFHVVVGKEHSMFRLNPVKLSALESSENMIEASTYKQISALLIESTEVLDRGGHTFLFAGQI